MRALWFDRSGWCMFSKRLERGSYQLPQDAAGTGQVPIDAAQFAMILEGIDLRAPRRLRYAHPRGGG